MYYIILPQRQKNTTHLLESLSVSFMSLSVQRVSCVLRASCVSCVLHASCISCVLCVCCVSVSFVSPVSTVSIASSVPSGHSSCLFACILQASELPLRIKIVTRNFVNKSICTQVAYISVELNSTPFIRLPDRLYHRILHLLPTQHPLGRA